MDNLRDFDITHGPDKLKKILETEKGYDGILLFSLEESLDWNNLFENLLPKLTEILGNLPYKIVVGDTCSIDKFGNEKILKANPFLLKTVYNIKSGHPHNTEWNYNSNKGLILTGKPNRENRIGFLIELAQRGILKNHIYSLFKPQQDYIIQRTKEIIKETSNYSYDRFFKLYENNPDNIPIRNTNIDMHYSGFPFSVDLFKDTIISVVLETNLFSPNGNNPDFSEKTYKTIINKHPFIILNQSNSLWFLRSYGFHTFQEYMQHPDYELETDLYLKNKLAADNLVYFIKNYEKNKDEIKEKIEFNYNLMLKIHDDFKQNYPSIYNALSREFFIR